MGMGSAGPWVWGTGMWRRDGHGMDTAQVLPATPTPQHEAVPPSPGSWQWGPSSRVPLGPGHILLIQCWVLCGSCLEPCLGSTHCQDLQRCRGPGDPPRLGGWGAAWTPPTPMRAGLPQPHPSFPGCRCLGGRCSPSPKMLLGPRPHRGASGARGGGARHKAAKPLRAEVAGTAGPRPCSYRDSSHAPSPGSHVLSTGGFVQGPPPGPQPGKGSPVPPRHPQSPAGAATGARGTAGP